jgi:Secretion system C-terminal sorting domain
VKLSNLGNILWQKSFGGTDRDHVTSIIQTTDSGYIFAGDSRSNDGDVSGHHGTSVTKDCWVVKLNNAGLIDWETSLGGTGNDFATSIQQTSDSGYIVAGSSESIDGDVTGNHGSFDKWIVKLNSQGFISWEKSLGGTGNDNATSIEQTTDGGYVIAGYTTSNDGDVTGNQGGQDNWIVKLNNAGIIEWQKTLGGTGDDWANSIQQTIDDGFVVAGTTASVNGDVTGHHGTVTNNDYWVVKLSPVILGVEEIKSSISKIHVIPNPFSQTTKISFSLFQSENISVSIYDIAGRLILNLLDRNLDVGVHQIEWNINENGVANEGVYYLNVSGESFTTSCKLVVVR